MTMTVDVALHRERTINIAGRRVALPQWPVARLLGGTEQVLTSLFSMLGLVVFSRLLDMPSFGIVGGALGIALIVQQVHDSLTVSPFVVTCSDPRQDRGTLGDWLMWHLLVACALALLLLALGLLAGFVLPDFGHQLQLASPILFGATLFSFARRMHYHWGTFVSLVLQTMLYGVVYALTLLVAWRMGWLSADTASWLLAVAFGVPGFIYCAVFCSRAEFRRGYLKRIARSRSLIASMGAAAAVWQSSYAAALLVLAVFAGPVAVAIFTATRTLERPIALIISTITDVDTSRAVRAFASGGIRQLKQIVGRVAVIMPALTGPPLILILAFPELFLSLVYGEAYADATLELRVRILVLVPLVFSAPLAVGLTVLRETTVIMWATLAGTVAGLAFLLSCALAGSLDATAANASLLIMQATQLPILIWRYRAKTRALEQSGDGR